VTESGFILTWGSRRGMLFLHVLLEIEMEEGSCRGRNNFLGFGIVSLAFVIGFTVPFKI
jgi:hypothetical protein